VIFSSGGFFVLFFENVETVLGWCLSRLTLPSRFVMTSYSYNVVAVVWFVLMVFVTFCLNNVKETFSILY
jgi:hypothetical protein